MAENSDAKSSQKIELGRPWEDKTPQGILRGGMAEEVPDRAPISPALRDAFWGAIGLYGDWGRGQAEPTVSLDQRPVAISAVCDIVECFDDEMPEHIWRLLVYSIGSFGEKPADRTYRSGARHFAKLINWRKEHFAHFDNLDQF